jgi:hypothetical protein
MLIFYLTGLVGGGGAAVLPSPSPSPSPPAIGPALVSTKVVSLFTDRRQGRQWLVTLQPHDGTGVRTVRVGTRGFVTSPSDSPPNVTFLPVLEQGPEISRDLWRDGRLFGAADAAEGTLVIAIDGSRLAWLDWHWTGRPVEARLALVGAPWSSHVLQLTGIVGEPQVQIDAKTGRNLVLPIFGIQHLADTLVARTRFLGTGGWEGPADLADVVKPLAFGAVANITPLQVDPPNRRWVFHGGAAQAVDQGYDGGNSIAGAFTADAANGRVTPDVAPSGPFTIDARGDAAGGVYVDGGAKIMQRLLTVYGPYSPAQLDQAAFDALHTALPGPIALYIPAGQDANLRDLMDQVCVTLGAWWDEDRQGRITCGQVVDPASVPPDLYLRESDVLAGSLQIEQEIEPAAETPVAFAPNWTPLTRDQLAGAVKGTARETLLAAAAQTVASTPDASVLTLYPNAARAEPLPTLWVNRSDAAARADRQFALRKVRRRLYGLTAVAEPYSITLGKVVFIRHPEGGLAAGKHLLVVRMRERAVDDRVGLGLWG